MNKLAKSKLAFSAIAMTLVGLVGCGASPEKKAAAARAQAEKAVMAFFEAIGNGDVETADKFVWCETPGNATEWAAIKRLGAALKTASDDDLENIPWTVPHVCCDFEIVNHPLLDPMLAPAVPDAETKLEMEAKEISDMVPVAVKYKFKPRFAEYAKKLGGFSDEMFGDGLVGVVVAVKHQGTWKLGEKISPLDIKASQLK